MKFFFDIYDYVMVIQLMAVSFSLVWVFRHLEKNWKTVVKCSFHFIAIFTIGTLLNYGLFELAEYVPILRGINFPSSWLIMIVLYLSFFCKMPVNSRVIMGATVFVSVITMTELGHYGAMVFGNKMPTGTSVLFYAMEDILIVAFALVIKKYSISKYTDIPAISAVLILINTTLMSLVVFVNTRFMITGLTSANEFYCLVLLVEYILVITGYLMIWFHCKVRKEKTELEVENRLLEADRQMLVLSEKAVEEVRCLKHDINNQYQLMKLLLEEKKYDELNNYFNSLDIKSLDARGIKYIDCGNELLNSIINMELIKANALGVDLTTKITVSEEINIDKSDLCRIIVNLVDNAIEAVDRYNTYDRPVDCKISKNKDYLYICVRNSVAGVEDAKSILEMQTAKQDPVLHGYGHRIVDKLVNKYNGHIKYSIEEEEFVAEAMLGLELND